MSQMSVSRFVLSAVCVLLFAVIGKIIVLDGDLVTDTGTGQQTRPLFSSLKNEYEFDNQPYAVMIDNHSFGRPYHSGLGAADVYYEALAEGGITRIMAIFDGPQGLSKTGPVRSARPYFVEWASEYGAVYLHVGGSDAALSDLVSKTAGVFNIEGMIYEGFDDYFKRDRSINRPHNDFANLVNMERDLLKTSDGDTWISGVDEPGFQFGKIKKSNKLLPENATEVKINFGVFPQYNVKYIYDSESSTYARYIGGVPHVDKASGESLTTSNVIVQFTDYWVIDDVGRLEFRTTGTGNAMLFRDGKAYKGTWSKEKNIAGSNSPARTIFVTKDGSEFKLSSGKTWVEVLNLEKNVVF
ncbi:MAG: DUF3048 domain-containing protein [Patescibacteria group bacterium]